MRIKVIYDESKKCIKTIRKYNKGEIAEIIKRNISYNGFVHNQEFQDVKERYLREERLRQRRMYHKIYQRIRRCELAESTMC